MKIIDSIKDSLGQFECEEQGWKGFGSLTFNTDEGGRLKLFRPKSTNPALTGSVKIELGSTYDVDEIEGQIEGFRKVKLVNCLSYQPFPVGVPLSDVYEFNFNSLFVADGNDAIPSEFDATEFRLRHQDDWIGNPSDGLIPNSEWFSLVKNPSQAVQISMPNPEVFEICLPEYKLIVTRSYTGSVSTSRFSYEPSSSLRIEYEHPTSLPEILEVVDHISSLISISLQAATPITEVMLFRNERKIQWFGRYGRLPKGREGSARQVERLHSFDNLGTDDVKRWLEAIGPLSDAVNLLLRHLYQDGVSYIDTSFSDVYRAMETIVIHFSNINDSRSGLNKKLLNFLLHEVRKYYVIDPKISNKTEWRDFVVGARNAELTHKRVKRESARAGAILEYDKLFYATQSLRQLTTIFLLSKCGLNENFIHNLYEYRGILINHLQKSNP